MKSNERMHTFGDFGVVRAGRAKPRGFRYRREDRCEAEEMVAVVAIVAKKQLSWGFAGVAFLANDVVIIVEGCGLFFGSWNSSSAKW